MAGFVFLTHDYRVVGPGIEQIVRRELGATEPLPYDFLSGGASAVAPRGMRPIPTLYQVRFAITSPRPFQLLVAVSQIDWALGQRVIAGPFTYVVPMRQPVAGTVHLVRPNPLRGWTFTGDRDAAALLSGDPTIASEAGHMVVAAQAIGTLILAASTTDFFRIEPSDGGSTLVLTRFGKQGFFGGLSIGAKELLGFLPALEARLQLVT